MKTKYIIGTIIAVAFVTIAVFSFDSSKIEYADIEAARQTNKTVQIIGSWDKDVQYNYDSQNNVFTFTMVDESQNSTTVVYTGAKPNNFDIAPMVVVKGKFVDDEFHANNILTKCPSKYEGEFEQLQGVQLYQ
jgi:cytochrome c-type biogenesis protein CcmE